MCARRVLVVVTLAMAVHCAQPAGAEPGMLDMVQSWFVGAPTPVDLPAGGLLLWPLPQSVSVTAPSSAGPMPLDAAGFTVTLSGPGAASGRVQRGAARYQALIRAVGEAQPLAAAAQTAGPAITTLGVTVASEDETLSLETSYNYTLTITSAGVASVAAQSPYGAMYGMETFTQVVAAGRFNGSALAITDFPRFRHRGFMIDTGRRFYPVAAVEEVLDGMAAAKMNVLHFHASDFCRFSVESKVYPELTSSLTGVLAGFYSQEDVQGLVAYAGDRGIRVVPEFDLPGHSKGFGPLRSEGVEFCSSTEPRIQLYDDPANSTVNVLKKVITEMAGLFPDAVLNIGCDETHEENKCTLANIASMEVTMQQHIASLGKTPMGWEELLFSTNAAQPGTIVDAWSHYSAADVIAKGFHAIESKSGEFYLNHVTNSYTLMWTDIAPNFTPAQDMLMLGGEVSMWTDNYCYIDQCGAFGSGKPVGYQLFGPSTDAAWMRSVAGVMWPRAGVAAGSFWNYDASLDATSPAFMALYEAHAQHLIGRGVQACPLNCTCDETSRCGVPYLAPNCTATATSGQNVANYYCGTGLVAAAEHHVGYLRGTDAAAGAGALSSSSSPSPASSSPSSPSSPSLASSAVPGEQWGGVQATSAAAVYVDAAGREHFKFSGPATRTDAESRSVAREGEQQPGDVQRVAAHGHAAAAGPFNHWAMAKDGTIQLQGVSPALCLTASDKPDPTSGSPNVDVETCATGRAAQQWHYDATTLQLMQGTSVATAAPMCLDITGHSSSDGANIEVYACNTPISSNQQWRVDSASGHIISALDADLCAGVCK